MAERRKLTDDEVRSQLASLDGWQLKGGKLYRQFSFKDFSEAWGFMARVALIAETMNHHPDWCNTYNRVIIELMTHDVGGLSAGDFEFATVVNKVAT